MERPGKRDRLDAGRLSLSVFFPCFNEEPNVERVTAAALRACRRLTSDFEVIIVNDGSSDRTGEIAESLAARHPEVRAVHNHGNRGYGAALQRGFQEATKEYVFYTDGDGQFSFDELPHLLLLLGQYDIGTEIRRMIDSADWGLQAQESGFYLFAQGTPPRIPAQEAMKRLERDVSIVNDDYEAAQRYRSRWAQYLVCAQK